MNHIKYLLLGVLSSALLSVGLSGAALHVDPLACQTKLKSGMVSPSTSACMMNCRAPS